MLKIAPWISSPNGALYHWCPACEKVHVIPEKGWARSGPDDAPTYSPSFMQYDAAGRGKNCHYNLVSGNIQFHPDSWHARNDTVAMPDIPISALERLGHGDGSFVGVKTDEVFRK